MYKLSLGTIVIFFFSFLMRRPLVLKHLKNELFLLTCWMSFRAQRSSGTRDFAHCKLSTSVHEQLCPCPVVQMVGHLVVKRNDAGSNPGVHIIFCCCCHVREHSKRTCRNRAQDCSVPCLNEKLIMSNGMGCHDICKLK